MKNQIYPCLWFDGQAKAAAEFYCSIFSPSKITDETSMVETNAKGHVYRFASSTRIR